VTRLRAIVAVTAVLLVLQVLTLAGPAQADANGFTRLRLTLSTTSDWARAELRGARIRVERTDFLTPGTTLYAKGSGWTIVPPKGAAATVVVDLVAAVPAGADPSLLLRKGMVGSARVALDATNAGAPTPVVEQELSTSDRERNELPIPLDPAVLGAGELPVEPVDPRRLTLAFYYPWFAAGSESRVGPDRPVPPFRTDRPDGVAAMAREARAAGVDGMVVSWSGDRHRESVRLLLDAAEAEPGFTVTPVLELRAFREPTLLLGDRFDPAAAARATRDYFELAAGAAGLEVDGRRVAFVFGLWDLDAREWAAFRAQVAELDLFLVGDRQQSSHPVDGVYDYDPNGASRSELEARAARAVDQARLRPLVDPTRQHQLWAATVSPGLDTRRTQPIWSARSTPRDGGSRYDMTWDVAVRADPDWVLITSWNEWYEQTHIAPGTTTGRRALEQTARWSSRF
jgi:hypothetical protein